MFYDPVAAFVLECCKLAHSPLQSNINVSFTDAMAGLRASSRCHGKGETAGHFFPVLYEVRHLLIDSDNTSISQI